jgi:hypothetical protein
MGKPTVKQTKVFAVIEQTLEPRNSQELADYLRTVRFTGVSDFSSEAAYNQGGLRTIKTKEHIPISMDELDEILAKRRNRLTSETSLR